MEVKLKYKILLDTQDRTPSIYFEGFEDTAENPGMDLVKNGEVLLSLAEVQLARQKMTSDGT